MGEKNQAKEAACRRPRWKTMETKTAKSSYYEYVQKIKETVIKELEEGGNDFRKWRISIER